MRDTVSALIILTNPSMTTLRHEPTANGEAVTEVEIDSLLRKVEDRIQVIVTARRTRRHVAISSNASLRCAATASRFVTDWAVVKPTLRTILRRLEAARVKQDSP